MCHLSPGTVPLWASGLSTAGAVSAGRAGEGSRVIRNCSRLFRGGAGLVCRTGCCLNHFVPAIRGEEPCPQLSALENGSVHWVMRISPSERHLQINNAE